MLVAFTLFSLAAGSLLVALGLFAEKRLLPATVLILSALAFFSGALLGQSPLDSVPVALLAAGFGGVTALLSGLASE